MTNTSSVNNDEKKQISFRENILDNFRVNSLFSSTQLNNNNLEFIKDCFIDVIKFLLKTSSSNERKSLNDLEYFIIILNELGDAVYTKDIKLDHLNFQLLIQDKIQLNGIKFINLLHSESRKIWLLHNDSLNTNSWFICPENIRIHLNKTNHDCYEISSRSCRLRVTNDLFYTLSLHRIIDNFQLCLDSTISDSLDKAELCQNSIKLSLPKDLQDNCSSLYNHDQPGSTNVSPENKTNSNSVQSNLEYNSLLERLLSTSEAKTIINFSRNQMDKQNSTEVHTQDEKTKGEQISRTNSRNRKGILERLLTPMNEDLSDQELSKLKTTSWLLSNHQSNESNETLPFSSQRKLSQQETNVSLSRKNSTSQDIHYKRSRHATTPGAICQSSSNVSSDKDISKTSSQEFLNSQVLEEKSLKEYTSSEDSREYKATLTYGHKNFMKRKYSGSDSNNRAAHIAANAAVRIASEIFQKLETDLDLLEQRKRLITQQVVMPLKMDKEHSGNTERLSDDDLSSIENDPLLDNEYPEYRVPINVHHYRCNESQTISNADPNITKGLSPLEINNVLKEIAPNRVVSQGEFVNNRKVKLIPIKPKDDNNQIEKKVPVKPASRKSLIISSPNTGILPRNSINNNENRPRRLVPILNKPVTMMTTANSATTLHPSTTVYQLISPLPQLGIQLSLDHNVKSASSSSTTNSTTIPYILKFSETIDNMPRLQPKPIVECSIKNQTSTILSNTLPILIYEPIKSAASSSNNQLISTVPHGANHFQANRLTLATPRLITPNPDGVLTTATSNETLNSYEIKEDSVNEKKPLKVNLNEEIILSNCNKESISSPPIEDIVNTVLDLEDEIFSDINDNSDLEKAADQIFKLPSFSSICKT